MLKELTGTAYEVTNYITCAVSMGNYYSQPYSKAPFVHSKLLYDVMLFLVKNQSSLPNLATIICQHTVHHFHIYIMLWLYSYYNNKPEVDIMYDRH